MTTTEASYLIKASFISALTAFFPWIRLVVGRKVVLEGQNVVHWKDTTLGTPAPPT